MDAWWVLAATPYSELAEIRPHNPCSNHVAANRVAGRLHGSLGRGHLRRRARLESTARFDFLYGMKASQREVRGRCGGFISIAAKLQEVPRVLAVPSPDRDLPKPGSRSSNQSESFRVGSRRKAGRTYSPISANVRDSPTLILELEAKPAEWVRDNSQVGLERGD